MDTNRDFPNVDGTEIWHAMEVMKSFLEEGLEPATPRVDEVALHGLKKARKDWKAKVNGPLQRYNPVVIDCD